MAGDFTDPSINSFAAQPLSHLAQENRAAGKSAVFKSIALMAFMAVLLLVILVLSLTKNKNLPNKDNQKAPVISEAKYLLEPHPLTNPNNPNFLRQPVSNTIPHSAPNFS